MYATQQVITAQISAVMYNRIVCDYKNLNLHFPSTRFFLRLLFTHIKGIVPWHFGSFSYYPIKISCLREPSRCSKTPARRD